MNCPECKSPEIASAPRLQIIAGMPVRFRKCRECGYGWSCPDSEVKDSAPIEPTPASDSPPADDVPDADDTEPDAEDPLEAAFDPETLGQGDVIRFVYRGEEVSGPVVSITDRTVVVDVDGNPDIRVPKSRILGRAG